MATNNDIVKEMALMEHRMDSMDEKLDKMDSKLDMLTERLLDPDDGVASRVNRNTGARKNISRALWVLYGIVAGAIGKMFLD
jgi:tetrahydromethanopterin S-methyltransferase subunit G